jgi:hypothetical protein
MEHITFSYKFNNRNPKIVYVSGSFDDLKEKHPLNNNSTNGKLMCTLQIKKGAHFYKYIIDGSWEINQNEPKVKGNDGIINNAINV